MLFVNFCSLSYLYVLQDDLSIQNNCKLCEREERERREIKLKA